MLLGVFGSSIKSSVTTSSKWTLERNGQENAFYPGYTDFYSRSEYDIKNMANNSWEDFDFLHWGNSDENAITINNEEYVRLTDACMALGYLLYYWDSSISKVIVYDWQVNGTTSPYVDSNHHIVGGSWLNYWSYQASDNIAPHFEIDELWSGGSQQLKIAVRQLQAAENIRCEYLNNGGMNITSGFRDWYHNYAIGGSGTSSHMKGKAMDQTSNYLSVYSGMYTEFCNGSSQPNSSGWMWVTKQPYPYNPSGAQYLEKDTYAPTWIHFGIQ